MDWDTQLKLAIYIGGLIPHERACAVDYSTLASKAGGTQVAGCDLLADFRHSIFR